MTCRDQGLTCRGDVGEPLDLHDCSPGGEMIIMIMKFEDVKFEVRWYIPGVRHPLPHLPRDNSGLTSHLLHLRLDLRLEIETKDDRQLQVDT